MYICGLLVFLACYFTSGVLTQDIPVSQQCLGCICEAASSCNITEHCSGKVCGPFSITMEYWTDSGKPTINGESPNSSKAFANCASDKYCSILSIQGYMNKFQQDCDEDGEIDCDDFTIIHLNGGYHCKGLRMPEPYGKLYRKCKKRVGLFEL
ncbi:unnamed protein product [Phaedon cochleariae]|uniref:lysozyme n=1 Tax=Phaedon cochleariae TaxID=80249 RepID=A0A9P0GJU3_PHACE|nr:unnamed protein product [Phaedon cochleariae]